VHQNAQSENGDGSLTKEIESMLVCEKAANYFLDATVVEVAA
jgi:hypothetical protein